LPCYTRQRLSKTQVNSDSLFVGEGGTGTLNIESGGLVSNTYGYIGKSSGATGSVTVAGAGSTWINSDDLYVGDEGSGTLAVNNGGTVVVGKSIYASSNNLGGNGTISANGGVLDADLVFDAAHGSQTSFTFGSGGTLTITPSATNEFGVGYKGNGTLLIAEGRAVASSDGYLGYNSGSTGTATVTGNGSKWTNSGSLSVGSDGTGTLNIEAGGQVSNTYGSLGYNSGSSGTVTVTGNGSKWTNNNSLKIGVNGSGILSIEAGGQVSGDGGNLGYNAGSSGTVTVTGAGSKWTIINTYIEDGALCVGNSGSGIMTIESGGQVSNSYGYLGYKSGSTGSVTVTGNGSTWNTSGTLDVGLYGSGTLNITGGGQISNTDGYLGYYSGSTGTVTVSGTGSTWTNNRNLYVGYNGNGTLTVSDGGTVIVGRAIYASLNNLQGNGTISANGGVLDAELVFDAAHGLQTSATFGSSGIITITQSASNALGVGYKGIGSLQITEGVSVASSDAYLGYFSGSSGTVTVTGGGSKWTSSNYLSVGYYGTGKLNIKAGGQVSNSNTVYVSLGRVSHSSGTATVTGSGSMWTNSGGLSVGQSGTGTLNIESGGLVSNTYGYIGEYSSAYGSVTVSGTGSIWANSGTLNIGRSGWGTLNIGNGVAGDCVVLAKTAVLGYSSTARATCTLNGGTLQTSSITKGTGTATFNWFDGTIRNYDTSTDLTVSGTNSLKLKLAATGTHAFTIDTGRTGTVSAVLSDATNGGTLAKQGDGLLVLSAANTYSGTTTIEGGQLKLVAGGDIAFSSEIINRAGFLIDGGNHSVQKITGSGTTQVLTGSLTAASIVQDTLTIGGPANAVPEPATIVLLAMSALAAIAWRRKSRVGQA
jgi:T5SS/PEP-CTERM-associated repeat protein